MKLNQKVICSVSECTNNSRSSNGYCGKHYQKWKKYGDPTYTKLNPKFQVPFLCSVEGCEKIATRKGAKMCEVHYYRKRRYNTTNLTNSRKPFLQHSGGYICEYDPNHPLSDKRGYVYQHRRVVYDYHENNPHLELKCEYCNRSLTWKVDKGDINKVFIDHRDENKRNNSLSNLVLSCMICNFSRSRNTATKNRRVNLNKYTWSGLTLTLPEWSANLNIPRYNLAWRLKHWLKEDHTPNYEKIFTTPTREKAN